MPRGVAANIFRRLKGIVKMWTGRRQTPQSPLRVTSQSSYSEWVEVNTAARDEQTRQAGCPLCRLEKCISFSRCSYVSALLTTLAGQTCAVHNLRNLGKLLGGSLVREWVTWTSKSDLHIQLEGIDNLVKKWLITVPWANHSFNDLSWGF